MNVTTMQTPSNAKVVQSAADALSSRKKGLRALLPFLGPAFVTSVAYIDPGNYATNLQGGSEFGYNLLWVVVLANVMAMLIQNMSAKLGIATGKNLPELCRQYLPRSISFIMWIFSEIAAMATDLAEFLGATIALNLLFHLPMLLATLLTGIVTYLILLLERIGFRPLERFITVLVMVIAGSYVVETFFSRPPFAPVLYHSFVPWIGNHDSIVLAVGIIGATVMPHAVYLHSGLTQNRIVSDDEMSKRKIFRFNTKEVIIAMTLAGLVNISMMVMAAATFHSKGFTGISDITTAYKTLTPLLGPASAFVFLISLLASGISSSAVGTMAGQVIMQGFVRFSIPLVARRLITMLPTVIIVILGVNPTNTLVISQVILSLVLPLPILSLIYFTRKKEIMGTLVNSKIVTVLLIACAVLILTLNIILLWFTLFP